MGKIDDEFYTSQSIEKLMQTPPKDIVQKAQEAGLLNDHYLIYRKNGKWDNKHKRRKLTGKCSACGKSMKLDFLLSLKNGLPAECPKCKKRVVAADWGKHPHGVDYTECGSLVFNRVGKLIVAVGYTLTRLIDREAKESISVNPTDVYIFGHKKPLRFAKWEMWGMNKYPSPDWQPRKQIIDSWQKTCNVVYPFDEALLAGTCLANSKVVQYLNNSRDSGLMRYCQQYLLYPGIENLITQGFWQVVRDKMQGGNDVARAFRWRELSPSKILRLNRPELKRAKGWGAQKIKQYIWQRDNGMSLSAQELKQLECIGTTELDCAAKEWQTTGAKIFRYIYKQYEKVGGLYASSSFFFREWKDYLNMAKNLGYDMQDESILFPPKLTKAHERAVAATKFVADEKLRNQFKNIYKQLSPLAWECDGLIIRPARSEKELISEGKKLKHCVGTYGKAHCEGKPIFFVRKADAPNEPYFTLQLNTATGGGLSKT